MCWISTYWSTKNYVFSLSTLLKESHAFEFLIQEISITCTLMVFLIWQTILCLRNFHLYKNKKSYFIFYFSLFSFFFPAKYLGISNQHNSIRELLLVIFNNYFLYLVLYTIQMNAFNGKLIVLHIGFHSQENVAHHADWFKNRLFFWIFYNAVSLLLRRSRLKMP